ncbi:MAG: hypothetical protein IJ318_02060, partial [Clostridia bacterium]|nr:hypothetical protein [Clostridia bacterium]
GDMYFYHGAYVDPETKMATVKTYDIVFQITITNLSESAITANIPAPTLGNTSAITMLDADDNAEYTSFPYEGKIAKNSQKTIMFAIRLTDKTALTEKVEFNWTGIEFEEWSLIKSDTVTNSIDSDNGSTYYYIEMGTNPTTGDPLRWVPFAVYDESVGDYTTFSKTDKPEEGKTYYFISEYVLDLYIDSTSTYAYGISYGYYASSDTSTAVYYVNGTPTTTSGIQPNDYSVSNIRSYLNGGEAYKCSDDNNQYYALTTEAMTGENAFARYFGLTSDPIYTGNYITSRPLTGDKDGATFSLYSDLLATTAKTRPTEESPFTATAKAATSDKDKLWLPSYFEVYNYIGSTAAVLKASRLTTQGASTQIVGGWWLRTPYSKAHRAYYVNTGGYFNYYEVYYSIHVARPAFQITIP